MRTTLSCLAVAASFILVVAACGGSSGAAVTMVFMGESFTMSGAAVDDGVVCPAGQGVEIATRGGLESDEFVSDTEVTCDDGSGTFVVRSDVTVPVVNGEIQGDWTIVGGSGGHAQLQGGGDFTVAIDVQFVITYEGELKTS